MAADKLKASTKRLEPRKTLVWVCAKLLGHDGEARAGDNCREWQEEKTQAWTMTYILRAFIQRPP